MARNLVSHNRRTTDSLHPLVCTALIVLALWFVLASWGFGIDGSTDYLLVVISGFFLIAAAIPFLIWRTSRRHPDTQASAESTPSLRDWMSGEFETWQGHLKAKEAAINILLPFTACAVGMTAFMIVAHVVSHGRL
jgi:hypothetical protein